MVKAVLDAECPLVTQLRQQHMLNEKQFIDDLNATVDNIIIFE